MTLHSAYGLTKLLIAPAPMFKNHAPIYVGIAIGLFVTPIAMLLWMASAGAGHGDYSLARAIYPIPMIPLAISEWLYPISLILAVMQFPIFGACIGWAYSRGKAQLYLCVFVTIAIQTVGVLAISQSLAFGGYYGEQCGAPKTRK